MINKALFLSIAMCSMILSTVHPKGASSSPKIIIWDLGNTLLSTNVFGFASEIGWKDFLLYPLLDWKNPLHIRTIVFTILDSLAEPQKGDVHSIATCEGRVLPTVMCNWLTGKESGTQICHKAAKRVEEYDQAGYFISARQKRLVKKTLATMFNPQILAKHMRPIKKALKVLRECALQRDEYGNPHHKLYILSNWDPDSFKDLSISRGFQKILQFIDPKNILISGEIGTLKPHATIYEHFIKKYKVKPADCILIDDQWENIQSAQKSGMSGILLEKRNYKKLKRHLQGLYVL